MKLEKPEMEIVTFEAEDIICTSGECVGNSCKIVGSEYCDGECRLQNYQPN